MIRRRLVRWSLGGLIVLVVLAVGFTFAVGYVDRKLADRSYESVYNDCHKVWATRGRRVIRFRQPSSNCTSWFTTSATSRSWR